jgi:hypothetical protein
LGAQCDFIVGLIQPDNGPEFVTDTVQRRFRCNRVRSLHIEPWSRPHGNKTLLTEWKSVPKLRGDVMPGLHWKVPRCELVSGANNLAQRDAAISEASGAAQAVEEFGAG